MSSNTNNVPEALSEIIGVAIEYDLHLEPNQFINYMDLYCTYLHTWRDSAKGLSKNSVSFYQFICNQPLLDAAASATEFETGEPVVAPTALQSRNSCEGAIGYLVPAIGVH